MTQEDLFKLRGKLSWEIEVAQAQLQAINKQLIDIFNQSKPEDKKEPA